MLLRRSFYFLRLCGRRSSFFTYVFRFFQRTLKRGFTNTPRVSFALGCDFETDFGDLNLELSDTFVDGRLRLGKLHLRSSQVRLRDLLLAHRHVTLTHATRFLDAVFGRRRGLSSHAFCRAGAHRLGRHDLWPSGGADSALLRTFRNTQALACDTGTKDVFVKPLSVRLELGRVDAGNGWIPQRLIKQATMLSNQIVLLSDCFVKFCPLFFQARLLRFWGLVLAQLVTRKRKTFALIL